MPYYHVGIIVDLDTDRTLDWQGLVEWPDGSNRCLFQAAIEVFSTEMEDSYQNGMCEDIMFITIKKRPE